MVADFLLPDLHEANCVEVISTLSKSEKRDKT